jgi:NAD-dependent DNA ligase
MKIEINTEDLIYKNKMFIQELQRVQDSYYDNLLQQLKALDETFYEKENKDFLFDYIFNETSSEMSFDEFLLEFTT